MKCVSCKTVWKLPVLFNKVGLSRCPWRCCYVLSIFIKLICGLLYDLTLHMLQMRHRRSSVFSVRFFVNTQRFHKNTEPRKTADSTRQVFLGGWIGIPPRALPSPVYQSSRICIHTWMQTAKLPEVHPLKKKKLECGPMPNVMVALPNIGGALCSTPQVWLTPTTRLPYSNAAKTRKPLKLEGVPQTRQQISAVSSPKFTILWGQFS